MFNSEVLESWLSSVQSGLQAFLKIIEGPLEFISNPAIGTAIILICFISLFSYSLLKFKNPFGSGKNKIKILVTSSLLIAINIVISYFQIDLTPTNRLTFGFITGAIAGTLFGPIIGFLVVALQDVISFLLKPTGAFLITLTIATSTGGILWGLFMYKKPITLWRIILAELIVTIVTNTILNSLALVPLSGAGIVAMLPARIVKQIIIFPIKVIILYIILKAIKRVKI